MADGEGRNSVWLAGQGMNVEAFDISAVGVEKARRLAANAGVAVTSALQFRAVVHGLGEKEIPRGYRTNMAVWLNFVLALVALALAVNFVFST
ncbi:hypothetical protein [Rhodoferax sp.]|uniref:hypothetical protein n=1 Tax=Rhodoferax sp. TaxID=50421 RepID=UPI00374D9D4D